jgi:mono/diheme cytochrome c family protein
MREMNGTEIRRQGVIIAGLAIAAFFMCGASARAGHPTDDDTGKKVFGANCVACHGEDGSGTPIGQSLNAPDLRSGDVQKKSDEDLRKQVSDGKNNMPPFKDMLTPDEIEAVVKYVRTFAKPS